MFNIAYYKVAALGFFSLAVLGMALSGPVASAQLHRQGDPFIVVTQDDILDLSHNGISSQTCMLVLLDGRFHIESKTERLPGPVVTTKILDYSLDSTQLQELQGIIGDERVRHLSPYAEPKLPIAASWSHRFRAKIARSTTVQQIGYWTWRGGTTDTSPNSSPEEVRSGWQESEIALKPLLVWLHDIEALKLSPSEAEPTMCNADADP
jgi:hypothetical protein